MNNTKITDRLTGIFREVFDDPKLELHDAMTASDIAGWDSVAMINIIVGVEERFQIRLRTREVDGLKTVGDLIALIAEKKA